MSRSSRLFEARRDRARGALAVLIALSLWSPVARADRDWVEDYDDQDRTLAGHRYVPVMFVDWAFIQTEISNTTAIGFTEFKVSPGPFSVILAPREGKFIEIAEAFTFDLAILPWLGLRLQGSGGGMIPHNAVAGVIVGAQLTHGGQVGLAARLLRVERFQLTARFDAGWQWTEDLIPERLPSSPRVSGDIGLLRPALAAAFTLAPRLGFQMSGSVAFRRFDVQTVDEITTLAGAAALTLVLEPVPLVLAVGASVSHDYGRHVRTVLAEELIGSPGTRWNGEGGLVYRGRPDLDVGLTASFEIGRTDSRTVLANLRLAYYF